MRPTPCPDCGAQSFAGASVDGFPERVVPTAAGDRVVIAWNVVAETSTSGVVFGAYDPREDDGSRRFARHACAAVAA